MGEHATDFDWATDGPVPERGAEVQSPLYRDAFTWVRSAIGGAEARLVLDQLLDDDSPQGVAQRDDLYLLTATTVHLAPAP